MRGGGRPGSMLARHAMAGGVLVGLLASLAAGPLRATDTESALEQAEESLAALARVLRPRAVPSDVQRALAAADGAMAALQPPHPPTLEPVDPDADDAARSATGEEHRLRLRAWERERQRFERSKERLSARWVALLGKAVVFGGASPREVFDPNGETCRQALSMLAATRREDASKEVRSAISRWLDGDEPWITAPRLIAAFEVLPRFQSPDVLDWLRNTFVGKYGDRPPTRVEVRRAGVLESSLTADVLLLALQAMARHDDMPGRVRCKAVRDLVSAYEPLEAKARHGGDAQELWGRIGAAAVAAGGHLAGVPGDDDGSAFATMAQLGVWLRRHAASGDPAWQD